MKLLRSTKNKITKKKKKNGENLLHLEITEIVFVHFNIVNNDFQQGSKVFYTFVPNKPFGSLLEIALTNCIFVRHLVQNFQKPKHGFDIKIVNHYKQKI